VLNVFVMPKTGCSCCLWRPLTVEVARYGQSEVVKLLLQAKADVNSRNNEVMILSLVNTDACDAAD
jgi:hypothetical protein